MSQPAVPIDPTRAEFRARLREVLSLFVTGVTVVTVRDSDSGEPRGMTANAFMSGSLDPPLVVISVRHAAKLHGLVTSAGRYGVSILADGMEGDARRFAGMPQLDQGSAPHFRWSDDVPVLAGALATITAEVRAAHVVGDHTLFVGEVRAIEAGDHQYMKPLGYFASTFVHVSASRDAEPLPIDPWSGAVDAWG